MPPTAATALLREVAFPRAPRRMAFRVLSTDTAAAAGVNVFFRFHSRRRATDQGRRNVVPAKQYRTAP